MSSNILLKALDIGTDFYGLVKGSRSLTKKRDIVPIGTKQDTKLNITDSPLPDLVSLLARSREIQKPVKVPPTTRALIPVLNKSSDELSRIGDLLDIIAEILNGLSSNMISNQLTSNMALVSIGESLKDLVDMKKIKSDFDLPNSILKLDEQIFKMYGIKPDGTIPQGTDGEPVKPLEDEALLNKEKHIEEKRSNKTDHAKDLIDMLSPPGDVVPDISDLDNPFNLLKDIWTLPTNYKIPNNLKE